MRPLSLLLAGLLGACSSAAPLSAHPTVVLDATFTPEETDAIINGVEGWGVAGARFEWRTAGHAEVIGGALAGAHDDTVWLVRVHGYDDGDCPTPSRNLVFPGALSVTSTSGSAAFTCLDVDHLARETLSKVAAHEMGHAFGLVHVETAGSLMRAYAQDEAAEPSVEDVEAWRSAR